MSNSFNVMSENPNLASGSNGCLCHELGGPDTKGPFVAFIGTETDNVHAPFPVICAGCALRAAKLAAIEMAPPELREKAKAADARKTKDRGTHELEDGPSI